LPADRSIIITEFIRRNNMLDINTYVGLETQQIINSQYLLEFSGGKYKLKKKRSLRQNKRRSKIYNFNKI
jgi:hypothetical protein